ncbi:MAG: IS1182 family transposase [Chloroflexi bacterium AL-N1]|nr:IS1182 family transposase [Chloroflexi bacterium AL-N1]NOK91794.1 IS1182 family transposase [Chloroflexi bacterium AL-N15]
MRRPTRRTALPDTTARVAWTVCAKGNLLMIWRATRGPPGEDSCGADRAPCLGPPAERPVRFALVTLRTFTEPLTDRAAADTVRGRIDGTYA